MGAAGISSCAGERTGGPRDDRARWHSGSLCLGSRQPADTGWGAAGCLGQRERPGSHASMATAPSLGAVLCVGRPVAAQYARIDHLEQQISLLETRRQLVRSLQEDGGKRSGGVLSLLPEVSLPRPLADWASDILRERSISEAGITHDELVEAFMQFPAQETNKEKEEEPVMTADELRHSWPLILQRVRDGLDDRASDLRTELVPLVEDVRRTERLIEDAFSKIDREHKGFITQDDIIDLCENEDEPGDGVPVLAERLFAALDSDRSGRVSRDDFRLQMTSGALDVLLRQIDRKKEERQRFRYFPPSLDRWNR